MNLELLQQLVMPLTVLGCLVIGYVLKNYIALDNKHIPLIMALCGILITVAINGYVSVEVTVIGGALSGLASTGLHQAFSQYINKEDK
mgnify:FL=1